MTLATFAEPGTTRPVEENLRQLGSVVVTGACGRLGRRLVRQLHRQCHVIGVDRRPFDDKPEDVEHFQLDLRRNRVQEVFKRPGIQALVHLGVMHNPRDKPDDHHTFNVAGFQKLLEYVQEYKIPKLILLSSGNVYGPRADNPQFLMEDAPLLGSSGFSDMRDLVEIDIMAQSFFWKQAETETVILRPAHILGTVHNAPSNYLRLKVVPTLLGFDPMIQVVHQDDVVNALRLALNSGTRGIFNIGGPAPVRLSKALKLLGRTRLPVPYSAARLAVARLFDFHLAHFPAPELDYIRYVCMVDDSRARSLMGYRPKFDIEQTLRAVDEERWT